MQTKDRFERHRFEGNRLEFEELEQCIKTATLNQCGDNGYQLLFPTTAWTYDAAGVITNLPDKYKYKEDPPALAGNAGAAARESRNAAMIVVEKWNKKLEGFFTEIRTIISRRCGNTLNITFNDFGNNPLKIWKYLKDKFGSGLGAELDAGDIAVDLCTLKMPNNEHFANWSTEFERKAKLCKTTDIILKGYLLSTGRNKAKIRMLPKRLSLAVEHCRQTRKTYEESKAYLEEACNSDWASGKVNSKSSSEIDAVNVANNCQGPQCIKCSNYGHYANQCHINFCTDCAKYLIDHDYQNCPYKQNKQKNVKPINHSNNKDRDNKGHRDKDDHFRGRSEDRDRSQETRGAGNQNGEPGRGGGRGRGRGGPRGRGRGRGSSRGRGRGRGRQQHVDEVSTYEADDYEDEYDERYDEDGVLIEQIYEEDDQYQDAEEEEMDSRPGQFSVYNLFSKQREDTERHVTKRKDLITVTHIYVSSVHGTV